MEYGIRELSRLAGVSARTLRYYDEIGLLKPLYVSDGGYRFYGEEELAILQQILFYRERDFDLKSIRKILYQEDFDVLAALEEHLCDLERQKTHTEALIRTVKRTISSMKGEYRMSDKEKFEGFQAEVIRKNEEAYGTEARRRYGDAQVEASNQRLLRMSEEEWREFKGLEEEICARLEKSVRDGISPKSSEAGEIVRLHRDWLKRAWKQYTGEAHKAVASMYNEDERFRNYYDRNVPGCAGFLHEAVQYWAERL